VVGIFSDSSGRPPASATPSTPTSSSSTGVNTESGERMSDADRLFRDRQHISGQDSPQTEGNQDRDREVSRFLNIT